jgi:hypothetical protein
LGLVALAVALIGLIAHPGGLATATAADGTPPSPGKARGKLIDPDKLLLPDLLTMPPSDLEIRLVGGGRRELRLANMVWNGGYGRLELAGTLNPETGKTQVHQQLYAPNESQEAVLVGEFVFHITHAHWHIENFARYELWGLDDRGLPVRVAVGGAKLSYCIIDTDRVDPDNPYYPTARRYQGCGRGLQGLSPGWGDQYDSFLDGQSLDITNVPDGVYALRSTANPDRLLREADYTNNTAMIFVEMRGTAVEVVEAPWTADDLCATQGWC